MFKRSRKKIVAAIMSVLTLLLLGTVAVIYASSYVEMCYDNYQMLQRQSQSYNLRLGDLIGLPQRGDDPYFDKPSFQLSTFYSVAVSDEGYVLATDTGNRELYDKATLQSYAASILGSGKRNGTMGNLMFLVTTKSGYTLVMFMDNTIVQERMSLLMRNTLIFGGVAMVGLFFLAVYLAKRIVKPLEESYQKQKQFISDAGHELKTPVSVVNTNAEMLRRELGENQWLANIQYENERMGLLVRQLLELARTENVAIQKEVLDLSRLVAGEQLPFESVAFEKGFTLISQIQPGLKINGNGQQLKQLVSIMIDNALEHSDVGGTICVKLWSEHGHGKLQFINDGPQIPPAQREHLFERFYRADEARGDDGHFGLGLAIANAIVQGHKGKIFVNCYDGKVEFLVDLPLQK